MELRLGEVTNCLGNHNRDSCVFPLTENARHKDQSGSKAAIKSFEEFLKRHPESSHAKWLLNVAHMTLGTYPEKLTKEQRLPDSFVTSKFRTNLFEEVSISHGLAKKGRAGGAYADDLDQDGFADIVFTDRDDCAPTFFFRSNGRDGFEDVSVQSGLADQKVVTAVFPTDFDNDGLIDLYLTRGAWDRVDANPFYKIPLYNTLMKNLGGGKFKDVTVEVGLRTERNTAVSANWVDFDGNGWVDVFVCNESREAELFLNEKGKFRLATAGSGISTAGVMCKSSAVTDVNGDGLPDLFLSLLTLDRMRPLLAGNGAENRLYLNRGKGRFEVLKSEILKSPKLSYPSLFFDYDEDGHDDLYVGSFNWPEFETVARSFFQIPNRGDKSALYKGKGDGTFVDVSSASGLGISDTAMAAAVGDLENSGKLSLAVGSGGVSLGDVAPNALYRIESEGRFANIAESQRFGSLQKGHGMSFADFNNDGALDILVRNGSGFPSDMGFPQLFINRGASHASVTLKLEGRSSNRLALGARVTAEIGKRKLTRVVGGGASFGANSLLIHVGLGGAEKIDRLEILWPKGSKSTTQVFHNIKGPSRWKIVEREEKLAELKLKQIDLIKKLTSTGSEHHQH